MIVLRRSSSRVHAHQLIEIAAAAETETAIAITALELLPKTDATDAAPG